MPTFDNGIVYDAEAFAIDDTEGIFAFDEFEGQLQPRMKQIETTLRYGIAGETMRNTGVRAIKTDFTAHHCVLDREAARDAIEAYLTLIDGAPHELWQHGFSWGMVRVERVTPLPLLPISSAMGTIVPFPTILMPVVFTVIATYVPPPEEP